MATGSTRSSGTDDPGPTAGPETQTEPPATNDATPAEAEHDPDRRAFFFRFGKQAVTTVGQVAGMADLVGRTSGGGIVSLLGLDEPASSPPRTGFARSDREALVSAAAPVGDDAFRSPYRLVGDDLVLFDQRGVPETLTEVSARRGSDVAYYLRLGVTRGGAVMAQAAAYGLALTAAERAARSADQRDSELRRTSDALIEARPSSRLLRWSVQRMEAARGALDASVSGDEVAAALRFEADAIASDLSAWQTTISGLLADYLAQGAHGAAAFLLHGDPGALSSGLVGPRLTALRRLVDDGVELRLFVTEGRPHMDGARLAAWQLRQAGLDYTIIPDSAVAWLFDREAIDAVLLDAEWVAADGAASALIGSRSIAQLAVAAGVGVVVSGVSATVDPETPDGAAIPTELRAARDLVAYLADVPVRAADALVPANDVIPAAAIDALVTERGIVAPGATS